MWQSPEHLRVLHGVPSLRWLSALGRKLVSSPELTPVSPGWHVHISLEISLGGAAAIVASRMTPVIAQGFLLTINQRHRSKENMGRCSQNGQCLSLMAWCMPVKGCDLFLGRNTASCISIAILLPSSLLVESTSGYCRR